MSLSRDDFLREYFKELHACNVPFVLLHSYEEFPKHVHSDVDYAVRVPDLSRLLPIVRRVAEKAGWRLVHSIQANIYSLRFVLVKADEPKQFVQLDSCTHYVEAGCFFFSDTQLLEGRVAAGVISIPAPAVEFAYLIAKAFAKGKDIEPLFSRLHRLWERDPEACATWLHDLFGMAPADFVAWIKSASTNQTGIREELLRRKRFGIEDRLRESSRAVKRVARPGGLQLALVGIAGYDTETLIARVTPLLEGSIFRSTKICRLRNGRLTASYLKSLLKEALPAKVRNGLVVFTWTSSERAAPTQPLVPYVDLTFVISPRGSQAHLKSLPAEPPQGVIFISVEKTLEEAAEIIYRRALDFLAARENKINC